MPCIQTPLTENRQAILSILVTPNTVSPEEAFTSILRYQYNALIDTGANVSAISEHVVDKIGIKPKSHDPISGIHGTSINPTYIANLHINLGAMLNIPNHPIRGINLGEERPYQAIIGMDILSQGTLYFNFPNQVYRHGTCTFCI